MSLTAEQVEQFVTGGFVKLGGAFPAEVGQRCLDELWAATGCAREDPTTWTEPVVRLGGFATPPFQEAATTAALSEAFDQLVGEGRWLPRVGLGTFPVRFPGTAEPGDDGWHVDAGYAGPHGEGRLNRGSRDRALLMLFLFSDVGPDDAPTRIRVGSHLDVPPLLENRGAEGREWMSLCQDAGPASEHRPVALATGSLRRLPVPPVPGARCPAAPGTHAPLHGSTAAARRGTTRPGGRAADSRRASRARRPPPVAVTARRTHVLRRGEDDRLCSCSRCRERSTP